MRIKLLIFLLASFLLLSCVGFVLADEVQISQQGLIAHYSFDEGSGDLLSDSSASNFDGTVHGASWTDGIAGKALLFDGTNSYVSLPPQTLGNWDSFTLTFWAKAPTYTGYGWPSFFGSYTSSLTYNTCIAISRNSGTLHLEIDTDTGNYETNGTLKIPWDTWFHAAMVYDGSTLTEYINGEAGKSIPASGILKDVSELHIGQLGTNRYFFNGIIDEAYIFNRALTLQEIQHLYGESSDASPDRLENHAAEKSPLSLLLDKKYVPIAATGSSLLFLFLWNMFGTTVVEFFFDFTSEKIRDKKNKRVKGKKTKQSTHKLLQYIQIKEIISILFAVFVFAVALSWTWSADWNFFFELFLINLLVVGFVFCLRESFRIYFSVKKNLDTQHVFWPFGALLTLGSTLLGNTFSLASYTVVEDETDKKTYGQMHFLVSLIIYGVCVFSFLLNLVVPMVFLQMIFVFCIMNLFIDLTPIHPMDGYEVKKWNFKRWLILYIVICVSYLIMNFSLFA